MQQGPRKSRKVVGKEKEGCLLEVRHQIPKETWPFLGVKVGQEVPSPLSEMKRTGMAGHTKGIIRMNDNCKVCVTHSS